MTVKITIHGDGLSFEGQTTMQKAAQMLHFISSESTSEINTPAPMLGLGDSPKKSNTPLEAIKNANAQTNPQKIAAFIKFYQSKENKKTMSSADLVKAFAKAGEPKPKNIARDIRDAKIKGFIDESDEVKSEFELTDKGVELLAEGFDKKKND